jgi:hypothetical protein
MAPSSQWSAAAPLPNLEAHVLSAAKVVVRCCLLLAGSQLLSSKSGEFSHFKISEAFTIKTLNSFNFLVTKKEK